MGGGTNYEEIISNLFILVQFLGYFPVNYIILYYFV